jgi:hypothetical protein
MLSIRLLTNPRRASLTSFGLLFSGLSLVGFALIALYESSLTVFGIALSLSFALAVSACLWPGIWIGPYRGWNKMSRHYGEFARLYLLGQCYMIVSAVGMLGPSREFVRDASSGSGWVARNSVSKVMAETRVRADETGGKNPQWVRAYALWVNGTGQWWRFALLPFMMLLSTFDIDDRTNVPTKTYTLF